MSFFFPAPRNGVLKSVAPGSIVILSLFFLDLHLQCCLLSRSLNNRPFRSFSYYIFTIAETGDSRTAFCARLYATMATMSTARGHSALAVSAVFTSLATLLVMIRIYTRAILVKQMGADDYAILISLVRHSPSSCFNGYGIDSANNWSRLSHGPSSGYSLVVSVSFIPCQRP